MNCKQGDIAIVIKCHREPNLGKIVEVGKLVILGHISYWHVTGRNLDTTGGISATGYIPDYCLKPLRGDPDEVIVKNYNELQVD